MALISDKINELYNVIKSIKLVLALYHDMSHALLKDYSDIVLKIIENIENKNSNAFGLKQGDYKIYNIEPIPLNISPVKSFYSIVQNQKDINIPSIIDINNKNINISPIESFEYIKQNSKGISSDSIQVTLISLDIIKTNQITEISEEE